MNFKALFMQPGNAHLKDLKDIKQMMDRSSRFISLSGWSGVAAGMCALVGAWFAYQVIGPRKVGEVEGATKSFRSYQYGTPSSLHDLMGYRLINIALFTFAAAFILAFIFTYLRSIKTRTPLWGTSARRLMINVSIPMVVGGIYLLRLVQNGTYGFIAPGCLIFYGLALVNGSKYTIGEVRFLGYGQIVLGLVNCWFIGYGLYFWAAGFGVLHIFYGIIMWFKYERNQQ